MASNHTEKYQLNQWDADDKVMRTDFNADNTKIEAALADLEDRRCSKEALMAIASLIGQINSDIKALKERVQALENA